MDDRQGGRGDESLMQDIIAQANQAEPELVDDILKQSSREKENLQREVL